MSNITPPPKDWREGRRQRVWQLYEAGWKQKNIAEALGVSEGAVSQWISKGRTGGMTAPRSVPRRGSYLKLTPEQRAQLPHLLNLGVEAFGFRGNVWTTQRVAWLIKHYFGINYHPAHCSRLLSPLKYSQQKPITRASQRDERAIARGTTKPFPISKKSQRRRTHPRFRRRVGILPAGPQSRTYAPIGRTRVFSVPLTHDHVSAIGVITPEGRIFLHTQQRSYKGPDVIGSSKQLLRNIPGKLLIIWDGASIHRSQMIKDFLTGGGAARLHLERLPAYAPEFNPQEGVWNLLSVANSKMSVVRHSSNLRTHSFLPRLV